MKVSVLVITYNQEQYIRQAIESILMQEVNFAYEIIVGEDASTDRTRDIVLELAKEWPDKLRVILHYEADAVSDRAAGLGGKRNFVESLAQCRGEYVALLDGDDYWTDPQKLQKQIDFLEYHPDFAICFHDATILSKDGSDQPRNYNPPDQKEVSTLEDLLHRNYIATSSVVFRRGLVGELPHWYLKSHAGDWPLHILNARHGKVRYINQVMSVYRHGSSGVWASRDLASQIKDIIWMLGCIKQSLGSQYHDKIKSSQACWYWELAREYYGAGKRREARKAVAKYLWLCDFAQRKALLRLLLQQRTPNFYHYLRSFRNFIRGNLSY